MPCEHISVHDDGQIFCINNGVGLQHGNAQDPPSDLTEIQLAAVEHWKNVAPWVKAIYQQFRVSLSHGGEGFEPTVNITLQFSVGEKSKDAVRLSKELQKFVNDLTQMGCTAHFYHSLQSVSNEAWWQFWKGVKRHFWQLTFTVIPDDLEGNEPWIRACLGKVAEVVENSEFSEFLVPAERNYEDYLE